MNQVLREFEPTNFMLLVTDGASNCKLARASVERVYAWVITEWCNCHKTSLWGADLCKDPYIVALIKANGYIIKLVRRYGWVQNQFKIRRAVANAEIMAANAAGKGVVDAHQDKAINKLQNYAQTRFFYTILCFQVPHPSSLNLKPQTLNTNP